MKARTKPQFGWTTTTPLLESDARHFSLPAKQRFHPRVCAHPNDKGADCRCDEECNLVFAFPAKWIHRAFVFPTMLRSSSSARRDALFSLS